MILINTWLAFKRMRAIVVRHYKTLINASGHILGWGDAPRVRDWEADLAFVDEILTARKIKFSAVYTSYLERARQTGMFYARKRGIHLLHDSVNLNEINYGELYRKSKLWVEQNIPQHKRDPDFVYPGGESFVQMQARSVGFLKSVACRRQDETILVVVHAGVIRGFISHFLGLPYAEHLKHKINHRYIGDFLFKGNECIQYDELGELSGFVQDDVVSIPLERQADGVSWLRAGFNQAAYQ
ncbi:MAG: histidine phosphatase family protein [Chromatiaceae bacterium]|nr:histidine phosphatase family protein [Chromatiaceae bacterium]